MNPVSENSAKEQIPIRHPFRAVLITFLALFALVLASVPFMPCGLTFCTVTYGLCYTAALAFATVGFVLAGNRLKRLFWVAVLVQCITLGLFWLSFQLFRERIIAVISNPQVVLIAVLALLVFSLTVYLICAISGWIRFARQRRQGVEDTFQR